MIFTRSAIRWITVCCRYWKGNPRSFQRMSFFQLYSLYDRHNFLPLLMCTVLRTWTNTVTIEDYRSLAVVFHSECCIVVSSGVARKFFWERGANPEGVPLPFPSISPPLLSSITILSRPFSFPSPLPPFSPLRSRTPKIQLKDLGEAL